MRRTQSLGVGPLTFAALAACVVSPLPATALITVGGLDTPGNPRDVAVVGGLAYVADSESGLRVIDFGPDYSDADGDGAVNGRDNCPFVANAGQEDAGGIGVGSAPDGIGDACQCGDVDNDGRVTLADAIMIPRSPLRPPTATLADPERCDVGGSTGCSLSDAVIIRRALLLPPTAAIQQVCAPARL